ncbi:hypothetical protein [Aliikangiella sp. IMCC44632]
MMSFLKRYRHKAVDESAPFQQGFKLFKLHFWIVKCIEIVVSSVLFWLLFAVSFPTLQQSQLFKAYPQTTLYVTFWWALAVLLISFYQWRKNTISESIFAEFLNRSDPKYQESTQLLLANKIDSSVQKIQAEKISAILRDDIKSRALKHYFPRFNIVNSLVNLGLFLLVFLVFLIATFFDDARISQAQLNSIKKSALNESTSLSALIMEQQVKIKYPDYTGLAEDNFKTLDIEVYPGSIVSWRLKTNSNIQQLFYQDNHGQQIQLKPQGEQVFELIMKVERNTFYHFMTYQNNQPIKLTNIASIRLLHDSAPSITITSPKFSPLNISRESELEVKVAAEILDDFGLSEVVLIASLAKGSGEAVKFRDSHFPMLQQSTQVMGKQKSWIYGLNLNLKQLGMEKGDEAYFRIQAKDNQAPVNNMTLSSSVIVRWPDSATIELAIEGYRINFIPEYFRSQRQIIIETKQLIEDRKDLTQEKFSQLSVDLGHSQADLKNRFGQYLGDEIGESEGVQHGLADGYHGDGSEEFGAANESIESEEHDDKHEHEHQSESSTQGEVNHQHENTLLENQRESSDLSGKQQLVAEFMHQHSTEEIGPLSNIDPKTWMKQAVSQMWQAELHLKMSQPKLALPYEEKAYQLLKRARQAERIYVKRLGFKPPPVSEKNRLSGELNNLLELSLSFQSQPEGAEVIELLTESYQLLDDIKSTSILTNSQIELLAKLQDYFIEQSAKRVALFKYATMLEKIISVKRISAAGCHECALAIKHKIWQLLPAPNKAPVVIYSKRLLSVSRDKYQTKRSP